MEEIKAPKKERKFLKAIGNIGKVLAEELVMGIARKFIGKVVDKVGNKKQGLVIAFIVLASSFVFAQFPSTGNKQRLGFQTTADGLVWRGSISDTASIQPVSNQNAWVILDTVNLKIYSFDFTSNVWNQVGGGVFAQPIDSLFFNVNVATDNVDTAKMRWDSDLATVVLGLNDNVPNELGFKNFWLVKNQTGSTITKGSLVYANGTVGASGRITVAKFIANGTIDAKYLLGITAHDLSNGEDGYVISFGKIRKVNTDTFSAGAILYPSPTVAGVWTDVEPIAPNINMPIGFCINSHVNNGTIAIRVASGYKLSELHDVAISSPVINASLYFKSGLWRDTTAALLVSDTAAMLANYATKAYADTSGRFYARQDFTNVSSSTLTWTQSDTLVVGGVNVVQVYRNGQILLPTQYTIPTNASVVIGATAYKVGENYTVIFPRGGGAGSGGGSGSLTSISGGTGIIVNPNPITTTGTVSADLSVLMELTDTSLLNLTTRFASKLNTTDTASLSTRIDAKGTGTVTSVGSGFGLLGGTITTTGTLRLDTTTIYARLQDSINVAIGGDTIKILKQEYQPALSSVLTWTITPKFPIQLKAYILVFRNGQLLNNDQYNLTDTNKITIVFTSFKIGANYTVATVSGIGSVGSAQAGNPVYPEAGIALSTGSTWASSITNNSSNWNTAFTDRLKWDGGSTGLVASTGRTSLGGTTIGQSMFTLTNPSAITFPQFNADNTVSTLSATSFRNAIGAGTVTSVIASTTAGNPISITNTTTTPTIELLSATSARNGYLTSTDWTTFNNKQAALGFTPANSTITIATTEPLQGGGNLTANRTLSITQATTSANGFLTSTDWNTFNGKQNTLVSGTTIKTVNGTTLLGSGNLSVGTLVGNDTISLSNRINLKLNPSDTVSLSNRINLKFNTADTSQLNLTSRFAGKLNYTDTSFLFTQSDTNQLNLTNRFAAKQNTLNGTGFVKASGTNITYDNSSYLTTSSAASTYLPLTGGTLTGNLVVNGTTRLVGNVAINTTTAFRPLEVHSNANDFVSVGVRTLNQGQWSGIHFGNVLGSDYRKSAIVFQRTDYGVGDYSGKIHLLNVPPSSFSENASLAYARMTINSNGNVGINDTLPTSTLSVNGTLAVTSDITENGNNVLTSADTTNMLLPYLRRADTTSMLLPYFRDADTTSLNLTSRFATKLNYTDTSFLFTQSDTNQLNLTNRFAAKQNTLTNPITGTGTNNFIPKFTTTGSTIGNSTLIDNGTTVSTASILSTTNYASLNAGNNTHRFTNTLSGNQTTFTPSSGFITSFFNANSSGGWYYSGSNSGFPILSILSTSNDRKKSGIALNSEGTANGTYTPAITFSSLSNSGAYYSAYAAIIGKKTGTGNNTFPDNLPDNNWNSGHLEFYGTTQATSSLGGIMRDANMVVGVGVGVGYTSPPTINGRLIVSEKIGIGNDSPTNTLDVSGTFRATGAATLSSTLAVTGDITENGNNVLTSADTTNMLAPYMRNADTTNMLAPYIERGDTATMLLPYWRSGRFSGTLPIANGGTGAESASVARTTLAVGYTFAEVTAGTVVLLTSNRVSLVNTGGSLTTQLDLTPATNGRMYMIKNLASGTVVSDASNVIPFNGGSAGTAILGAGNVTPQWCTLVADGTNWHIMQRN
jgi:hypothetical protein